MESGASAKVTHDIVIDNQVAFKAGETVMVEAVSPNEQRHEYKYVVTSPVLGKKFSLSDADLSELPPGAAAWPQAGAEMDMSRHQEKKREHLQEESKSFDERLVAEGVDPRLAATIAGEEFQIRDDLGELGPDPGTHLSFKERRLGEKWAPHEDALLAHTSDTPGTCPRCGNAVTDAESVCPSCGWHLNEAVVPARPRFGYIKRDVTIGGAVVFHRGELVRVDGESPDEQRPANKYVVTSQGLSKQFHLSDEDVSVDPAGGQVDADKARKRLEGLRKSGALTQQEYEEARDALLKRLSEGNQTGE